MNIRRWLVAVLAFPLLSALPLSGQTWKPKIVDSLAHYSLYAKDGTAFVDRLLAKLDSVDGMAILTIAPEDLDTVTALITPPDAWAWERSLPR
jgi:hypothetical protein